MLSAAILLLTNHSAAWGSHGRPLKVSMHLNKRHQGLSCAHLAGSVRLASTTMQTCLCSLLAKQAPRHCKAALACAHTAVGLYVCRGEMPRGTKVVQSNSCGCSVQHGLKQNNRLMSGKQTVSCRQHQMPVQLSDSAHALSL